MNILPSPNRQIWASAVGTAMLLLFPVLAGMSALAQEGARPDVADTLSAAKRSQPQMSVIIDKRTGLPARLRNLNVPTSFVRHLGVSSAQPPSLEAIKRAVDAFFSRSLLRSAFPQGNSAARRVVKIVKPDPNLGDLYIATVEQEVNGIPVFGSSGKVAVSRSLAIRSLSASFSAVELVDTIATVTQEDAIKTAQAALKRRLSARRLHSFGLDRSNSPAAIEKATPRAVKTVFDPKLLKRGTRTDAATRLTWLVSIDSYRVFVDAKNAKILYYYRDHRSFTVRRIVDFNGGVRAPKENAIDEETSTRAKVVSDDAVRAYYNSGAVRDYFFAMFGRKSFDDGKNPTKFGAPIVSYVRYGTDPVAHWCPSISFGCPLANVSVYGPGYAGALDVMGHEFMHGVVAHEANLVYLDEAGAVNEALADLFGSLIELRARGGGGNWLVGDELPGMSAASPLRSMADPALTNDDGASLFTATANYDSKTNRGQPSHYDEYVQREDAICRTTNDVDNGCVHFNSGIFNKFAYLIAKGGVHHGITVAAIGTEKLGHLAYRALRTKLNQTSGLQDAAYSFVDACYEFAGAKLHRIEADDCVAVERAQQAVGLNVVIN